MRTQFRVTAASLAAAGLLLVVCGCAVAPAPTAIERDYGLSHRLALYGQTANPDAEQNLDLVEGIEGKASLGAMNGYREGFGYSTGMDASSFDVRPVQSNVSEVRIKDISGNQAGTAQPNITVNPK